MVLGVDRPLGPFETRAVALRWRLAEPWLHGLGSGWLGDELVLAASDGRRVVVPLRGVELSALPARVLGPLYLEPNTPQWIHDIVDRPWLRRFHIDRTTWTEAALCAGDQVELEGCRIVARQGGYRDGAGEADADLVADGPIHVRVTALAEPSVVVPRPLAPG